MNARSWFCLGVTLIGVYYLADAFVGLSGSLIYLSLLSMPDIGSTVLTSTLAPLAFKLMAGLFLVVKAPVLSRGFERRLEPG